MMDQEMLNGLDADIDVPEEVQNGDANVAGSAGSELMSGVDLIDTRIKRKAKRVGLTRQLSKEAVLNGGNAIVQCTKILKNSRRPMNGHGRGLPKKGGAGGKGVWGKPGSELLEVDVDMEDPNYDSDSLDNGDIELKSIVPEMADEEIQKHVDSIILEYFEHGDTSEAALAFDDINCGSKRHMIPMLAVEMAMSHKPSHCEMTSRLISDLYGRAVRQKDIGRAFEVLLKNLPDLILDTPEAPSVLGSFLARAVADDCLPPRFVAACREKIEGEADAPARQALLRADTLLSMKHGLVRLDNVWGVGGGLRPVKYLVRQMALLLREYISSGDLQEATRCLLALEVPHFHHELVYEAVVMTIEAINAHTEEVMCRLLKSLSAAVIITPDMMQNGFLRVFEDMPDICLDVPLAYTVLERFMDRCQKEGFLTEEVIKKMPSRGRKRFVSEGDGGRVKSYDFA